MIYQDQENVYIKVPITFAGIINKSIVQACLSMKQDTTSSEDSIHQSEIILLQLANFIYNAKSLSDDKSALVKEAFSVENSEIKNDS